MRYQLLQINNGEETVLLDTDSKQEIRNHYDRDDMQRIRVDGQTLLIFQAKDWLNNLPIREPSGTTSRTRYVIQTDVCGREIARFHSASEAARKLGYHYDTITTACRKGIPMRDGSMFKYAQEVVE